MKLRDPKNHHLPPPEYDPKSKNFTVHVYVGGSFHIGTVSAYVGGMVYVFDYFDQDYLSLDAFEVIAERKDPKALLGVYIKEQNDFRLIRNDNELQKLCAGTVTGSREIKLYIGNLKNNSKQAVEEDSERDGDEESEGSEVGRENYGGEEMERDWGEGTSKTKEVHETDNDPHGDESESDFEDSLYNMSSESDDEIAQKKKDDKLYNENVDHNVEWSGQDDESDEEEAERNESGDEDVMKSDDELDSCRGSDSESDGNKFPVFNPIEQFDPTFVIGMIFSTKTELRQAIHSHAIKTKRNIKITKNDKLRLHAKCAVKECGWKIHALKVTDELTFQIRMYNSKHTCGKKFHVKNITATWISKKYIQQFKSDPKRNINGFRQDAIFDIRCNISKSQAYRAKRKAIEMLEGAPDEQYALLWDYANEIKRTNPGSTVIIGTGQSSGENKFDRFYCCLHALKMGFFAGCRPLIGVDGCHLKGPHGGVVLTAVGIDPNNNIYPIAYAVVNKESGDTWDWFLTLLKIDLSIEKDYEWTFISDKQKGLIQAFQDVLPNADHRFCIKHLHNNFKTAGFRGQTFKIALWRAAKATTVNEFRRRIDEMRAIDVKAVEWFNDKPPKQWSRAHFSDYCRCDMLLNNGCESFNSNILEGREKPIVSMLEWIMEKLMKRLQENRDRAQRKWDSMLCPRIKKVIDRNFDKLGDCIPIKADDYHYQISCFDGSQYSVDLKAGTCGCRKWDLTGIPCKHALCAIMCQGLNVEDYTHKCYRVDTYKKVYEHTIMPINGRSEWIPTEFIPPLPPNLGRPAGRPKKTRRREPDEVQSKQKKKIKDKSKVVVGNGQRLKRQQTTLKCSHCGGERHNKRGCYLIRELQNEIQDLSCQVTTETQASEMPQKLKVRRKKKTTDNIEEQVQVMEQTGTSDAYRRPEQVILPTTKGKIAISNSKYKPPYCRSQRQIGKDGQQRMATNVAPTPTANSAAKSSMFKSAPSMYQQLQQDQPPRVKIGRPNSSVGRKYVTLTSLTSAVTQLKKRTNKLKKKGNN